LRLTKLKKSPKLEQSIENPGQLLGSLLEKITTIEINYNLASIA